MSRTPRRTRTAGAPHRSRAPLWRALLALVVVGISLFFALTTPARLGLDLKGGTHIVLETRDGPGVRADRAATDRALEVLRQRVDALGVAEPSLSRAGENRIVVELPGVQDPREAAEVIGRTAQLTFHPVAEETGSRPAKDAQRKAGKEGTEDKAGKEGKGRGRTLPDPDAKGLYLRLGPTALTGEGVKDAEPQLDTAQGNGWSVTVDFRDSAAGQWAALTGRAACQPADAPQRRVAIVLDDRIVSAPRIQDSVACRTGITGGSTQITGNFSAEEAKDLAALVKGGALPVPVDVVEQQTVGPTLGADAIRASAQAAVIGLVCTAVFITVVYRLLGALATLALGLYGLISYASLVALGATLTLPGLAGFVLAVGMAVDANVLVFERAREEYNRPRPRPDKPRRERESERARGREHERAQERERGRERGRGPDLRRALRAGFQQAYSAVIDSNVTTLLAAGLLFFFATGPVKGFGVTLSLGVLASMISAMVITRVLADWAVRRPWVRRRPALTGLAGDARLRAWLTARKPRFARRPRLWLSVMAGLVLVALAGIGLRGLELGVEFTGGRLVEYSTSRSVDADTARSAVADAGFPRAVVQEAGDGGISVRTEKLTDTEREHIREALEPAGGEVSVEQDELVGPSLGSELRDKALLALSIAVGAQLLYLSVRFRWTLAAAAVAAMVQDVLLVVGLFAWLGKPVDGVFLAALLTVVGYSVNDTVVVLDRLRGMRRSDRTTPLPDLADAAVLRTLPRTVNTGMGALFILVALALLGGDSLTDFSVALLAGVVFGMASTVLTATPLAVALEQWRPAPRREPTARQRGREGSGAVV
ncbi:protein translocase subunit SecD [Streptomyces oryzae]|uniref:Multifunctional fusion protein n=1 Tax=Streptomyces oryzae TaxID=1434886 RepID=A0ABS3X6P0_9ACTN|nr:protein translocase subunit SecD [Streptomyces oryzae]MBO8191026.1 protein translocase subunit SecD [Streptomyces oryzae]